MESIGQPGECTKDNALLSASAANTPPQGVTYLRTGELRRPLFCVVPMFGAQGTFGRIADLLPPDLPVIGLDATHVPIEVLLAESIEEQGSRLCAAMRAVQSEGPYRLTGFSFGAHVAYEIARRLVHSGAAIEYLGILDTVPACDVRGSALDRLSVALDLMRKLPSRAAMAFRARRRVLAATGLLLRDWRGGMGNGARLHECVEALRIEILRHGGPQHAVLEDQEDDDPGVFEHAARLKRGRIITANKQAIAAYHMEPLPVLISLVASTCDRNRMAQQRVESQWRRMAQGGFEAQWVDCGHTEILLGAGVERTATAIARTLAALDAMQAEGDGDRGA